MPYTPAIPSEAQYLGPGATQNKLYRIYHAILMYWFPISRWYMLDHTLDYQNTSEGYKPGFIALRHIEDPFPPPFLVVKFQSSSEWESGKDRLQDELIGYLERLSDLGRCNTIYGVGGIGLHWMAYKMDKGGQPVLLLDWQDDITSDRSYEEFQTIANLMYRLFE